MPRQSDARQKMIESAAVLFRERGVQGTSFADVIERSGAPRGSIYHHFPGGKSQLAQETTQWAGEFIIAGTVAALAEDDPVRAIVVQQRQWTKILRGSDYAAGCVIVAATLDGDGDAALRATAAAVFADWEDVLTAALRRRALPAARARSLATLIITSIEGAIIISRAERSTRPLERVSGELEALLRAVLPPAE